MDVLPVQLKALRICGFWFEEPKKNRMIKYCYIFLSFMIVLYYTLLQAYYMLTQPELNIAQISDTLFLLSIYIADLGKFLLFVVRRDQVGDLLDQFRAPLSQPRNTSEIILIKSHQRTARIVWYIRMMISTLSCGSYFVVPIVYERRLALPLPASFWELSTPLRYYFNYFLQVLAVHVTAIGEVTLDSVACAFIILTCAQLELSSTRLLVGKGLDDKKAIEQFVNHQLFIQGIMKKFQSTFIGIIVPVFCFGLLTICMTLFKFTQMPTILVDRIFGTFYLGYVLFPIYVYCWYGNKIQVMSENVADSIYESDWTSLTASERRSHWYLIFMSQKKYEISYHGQCILILQTFIWIMKTSYGAFNLLRQVSLT